MPKSGGVESSTTVSDNEQLSFLPQSTQASSPRYRSLEPQHELSAAALQQWKEAMAKGRS